MPDPGFVTVFHAETGNYAEQPQSALPALYRGGWALVTDTPPAEPEPEARHISRGDAEETRARVFAGNPPPEPGAQGEMPRTEATPGDGTGSGGEPAAPAGQPPSGDTETAGEAQPRRGRARSKASDTEE